jgi:hypothetical protein
MLAPAARVLNGKAAVQVPMVTVTGAPALSTAVAPQVGAVAAPNGETLDAVQVMLVLTVLPGLLTIGVAGWLTLMSELLAAAAIATATEPKHGVATVQERSPPPLTVAVLLPVVAVAATLTGTEITMGPAVLVGIVQPSKLIEPTAKVQPAKATPLTKTGPLVVIPVGSVSFRAISAVVGPLETEMVML